MNQEANSLAGKGADGFLYVASFRISGYEDLGYTLCVWGDVSDA